MEFFLAAQLLSVDVIRLKMCLSTGCRQEGKKGKNAEICLSRLKKAKTTFCLKGQKLAKQRARLSRLAQCKNSQKRVPMCYAACTIFGR